MLFLGIHIFTVVVILCSSEVCCVPDEKNEIVLQCAAMNSYVSILVTYPTGQNEVAAEFTNKSCVAYRNLKCAAKNGFNIVSFPGREAAHEIMFYSCCNGSVIELEDYRKNSTCIAKKPNINSTNELVALESKMPLTLLINSSQLLTMFSCSKQGVVCSVPNNDVNSMVSLGVSVDNPDGLNIEYNISQLNATIIITATREGRYKLICSVKDDQNRNEARAFVTINVSANPNRTPVLVVNNGITLKESNDKVNVKCNLLGQFDDFVNLTLSCPGETKSSKDTSVTFLKKFSKQDNGFSCTCTAYFTSSCNPSNEVHHQIIVPYGPSSLDVQGEDEPINLLKCSKEQIQCIVPQNDFYPGVDINCNTDSQEMMSITKKNISNTQGTATFEIYAWKVGTARLICRAVNTENQSLYVESEKKVTLQEREPPLINTKPKLPLVETGFYMPITITCSVILHIKIKNITMECFGITNGSTARQVVISRNLSSSDYNTVCRCKIYYDDSSCFEETELHIEVLFIPKILYPNYDSTIDRCQTKNVSIQAYKDDFYPGLRFEFTSDNNRSIYFNQSTSWQRDDFNSITQIINYTALLAGTYTMKCTAYNTKMDVIRREKRLQVNVLEPVLKETILTFNGGNGFTDRNYLRNTKITCTASDPRPFSSLSLNCLNEQITSSYKTITMDRDLTSNVEENYCHCNAEYFDSCFGHTESAVHINLQCSKPQIIVNSGDPIVVEATYTIHSITCGEIEDNKLASTITLECLGEAVSSFGTNLTVYRNVSIDSQGASCVCIIDSPYCLQNRTNEIKIDVKYHLGIINYNANGLNQTQKLREGEKVVFTCLVESNPAPNITVKADDNDFINGLNIYKQTLYEKDSNHWIKELTLDSVKCQDTNIYTCTAINNVTNTMFTDSIQILVECPLQVYKKSNTLRQFIGYIDEAATVSIKIYGYPLPKQIILVKSNTKEVVDKELYEVNYRETKKPIILVELLIYRLTKDNFTLYSINISNGIGKNLKLEFKIDQESSNDETTHWKIGLGLGVPLGLAILVIVYIKRKELHQLLNRSGKELHQPPNRSDYERIEGDNTSLGEGNRSALGELTTSFTEYTTVQRGQPEDIITTRSGQTEDNINTPIGQTEDNITTPSGQSEDNITTPSGQSEDNITTPSGQSEDNITTPSGKPENNIALASNQDGFGSIFKTFNNSLLDDETLPKAFINSQKDDETLPKGIESIQVASEIQGTHESDVNTLNPS